MQESKRRREWEEKQKYTSEGDHGQELQTDGATREMRHNTENNFGHQEKILNSSEKKKNKYINWVTTLKHEPSGSLKVESHEPI